jgi:eukaryotic-like serine/threonine-protein kinase
VALAPGTRLGAYEILTLVGTGGMGEVYRARDRKLDRDVAIKILPDALAADPDRIARFEREAKTLAALNHPNIAHIHGLEDTDGIRGLVMELVEGPTLADRVASGPIPLDEALPIAKQIAEALEAAHEQGIIHRDLKPANIKVRPDGTVKVLDFGLAKAFDPAASAASSATMSPTISIHATQAGIILGTAAYMAPEQARGRAVDRRADIWAFGCVLFEMLTGRRAFDAEDVSLTLAEVIKSEPDWAALPVVPPTVWTFLRQCFKKDPRQRLRDIGDMRLALEGVLDIKSATGSADVRPRGANRIWMWAVACAAAAAVVATFAALRFNRVLAPTPEVVRFEVHAPAGSKIPPGTPAISPDGRTLAYVVTGTDGTERIYLRDLASTESRPLPGTENAVHPFWSPDGRSLAFASNRILKRIDVAGGPARELAPVLGPWHGSWNQFGDLLFASTLMVSRIPADGGAVSTAATGDVKAGEVAAGFPAFLPDGRRFLTRVGRNDGGSGIYLASLDSPAKKLILNDVFSAVLVAPTPRRATYLLYLRDDALVAHEFDEHTGEIRGTPRPVVDHVGRVANPALVPTAGVSASALAYQTGGDFTSGSLFWVSRAGEPVGSVESKGLSPSLSPDQRWVATLGPSGRGDTDVWVTDLTRGVTSRITRGGGVIGAVVWSPDSRRVAFAFKSKIYVKTIDGSTDEAVLVDVRGIPNSWSPDGQYLLYGVLGKLFLWPLAGGKALQVGSHNGSSRDGRFSPDGQNIAYVSDEGGRDDVYIQPLPPATGRIQVSAAGGAAPRWSPGGRELFFVANDPAMMAVDVQAGQPPSISIPRKLFAFSGVGNVARSDAPSRGSAVFGYDITADGQRLLMARGRVDVPDTPITVVLNWWADLLRKSE